MSSSDDIERRLRELKSEAREDARQTEQDAQRNQTQPPGAAYGWVPPAPTEPTQPAHEPPPPASHLEARSGPSSDPEPGRHSSELEPADGERRDSTSAVPRALVAGAVAAGVVWLLFAILPFLGAFSGAAGAFVGAFAATLIWTYLRR